MQTCTLALSQGPKSLQFSLVNESCSVALLLLSLWTPNTTTNTIDHTNYQDP